MEIVCKKCGYKWNYKGSATRISCSKCKTSITIRQQAIENIVEHGRTAARVNEVFDNNNKVQLAEFILPLKVIDSHAWSGVVGRARHLDNPIILIANKQGELSLKP